MDTKNETYSRFMQKLASFDKQFEKTIALKKKNDFRKLVMSEKDEGRKKAMVNAWNDHMKG